MSGDRLDVPAMVAVIFFWIGIIMIFIGVEHLLGAYGIVAISGFFLLYLSRQVVKQK